MRQRFCYIAALFVVVVIGAALFVSVAVAQESGKLPAVFDGVGMDEQLGDFVPQDLLFVNEAGEEVQLGTYLDGEKPVLLNLVYHDCPMLCNIMVDGLTTAMRELEWTPGDEYAVLTVSFNAIETPELASRQKERYVRELGKPGAAAGWHFLTGDKAAIDQLTKAVGFNYRWVEAQQEYAHPAALIFLSGEGQITRYLYGLEFASRDVRRALVEASAGTVGTVLDQVILFCFQYDPDANSYVLHAQRAMKMGGLLMILVLGTALFILWRREGENLAELEGMVGSAPSHSL